MSEEKLSTCPFCGCASLTTAKENPNAEMGEAFAWWHVSCDDCMAQGPLENTQEEAEAAWNRRW